MRSILPLTKHNFKTAGANKSENFTKMISSFESIQRDVFLIVLNILANSSKENFASFVSEDALWDKFVS